MGGTTGKVVGTAALAGALALSGCSGDGTETDVDTELEDEQIEQTVDRFGVPGEEESAGVDG